MFIAVGVEPLGAVEAAGSVETIVTIIF